jgi:hypothetical protein
MWLPVGLGLIAACRYQAVVLEVGTGKTQPGTLSRTSRSVIPPNLRNSSWLITEMIPGASARFSENLEAVMT